MTSSDIMDREDWWEWGTSYSGKACGHCGRERVQTGCTDPNGIDHEVCEKCGWEQNLHCYAQELVFHDGAEEPRHHDPSKG